MKRLPVGAVPVLATVLALPTSLAPGSVLAQVTYPVAFAGLVVLAWLGLRRRTGRARVAHGLMAGALTVWLCGDLLYALLVWHFGELGDVSAADVLWVLGYPLLAAGLVLMVRLRAPGRLREAALDVLAMATVVAALFWQFMVAPEVSGSTMSWAVLFTAFYPFGDVLLFAAGALVVLTPGERAGPTRYLVAALTVTFVGDVTISAASLVLPDFDTGHLDGLLLLANGLFAAALWHPAEKGLASAPKPDAERLHPARVVFLGVSLLALPALSDVRINNAMIHRTTMLAAMMLLTAIVLVRFTLVVREQELARAALAHRATHDQLTGLINRQELHARLAAALLLRAGGGPVVHFLDLNGFKPVNDRYGHAAGDFVLSEVARRLRATVRETDTVARLGGDEFVVLSGTPDDAAAITDRLRTAVTAPLHYQGHDLRIGVSVGHASAAGLDDPTSDALLAAADADMYREKAAAPAEVTSPV
ncbi:diguanylate cyclase [Actinoplanes sp. NPDC049599]|uniref:diguanylate cyclase n=1 Tax=Actinoplanes sp. NPDC049599 TaxID=3363903 RepID=UPI0037BDE61B